MELTSIPLGHSVWKRRRSGEPDVNVLNRFFETNPTNQVDQVALLLRPGLTRRISVGSGPIRGMYTQAGSFDGDLFVVSGDELYRIHRAPGVPDVATLCTGSVAGDDVVEITSPSADRLFVADGITLQTMDDTNILSAVAVPDGLPVRSVGSIASYCIVVINGSDRFYWIEPGEITIDPLNFATAERGPDPIQNVKVIGDQIWFFGKATTEVWYLTGDALAPFARTPGRVFDKGVWQGTAVAMENLDVTILVGQDGVVYSVGSQPTRISTNGLEELIRTAMKAEEQQDGY
jgi:hypothetical protein